MTVQEERWQRVKALMLAAAEREGAERAAFLTEACGGDPSLRREVESLLAADRSAAGFLERPAIRIAEVAGLEPAALPSRVGPYRILERLGSGGMGTVFLAVREESEYCHRVAVKVLRPGAGSAEIVRRFRNEGRILSRLEHANVARLLDGGTTAEGLPFLVMEHIQGESIDRYCAERRLSVGERLELFLQVCAAVEFAHRNLVVHRDLKPGNVLVTEDGTAKLLDFGIAKLLRDGGVSTVTPSTAIEMRPMTPEYASPEQVRGEAITTATDVYALGLMLYELLTGQHAYRHGSRRLEVVLRTICQQPERPSAAAARQARTSVTGEDGARHSVSRTRGEARRLQRRLKGDLDNIVLMALRQEPERRYRSVQQLAEDLRQHLAGAPVTARKATFPYRAGKFVRRHAAGVAVASMLMSTLVVFAFTMAFQREQLASERDRSNEVLEFFVGMFEAADPTRTPGEALTVREVLDHGAVRVREELGEQPERKATLLNVIGKVHLGLGLYGEAEKLLSEALAIRRQALGDRHLAVATSLHNLGVARRLQGDHRAAEGLLRRALAIHRERLGEEHLKVVQNLSFLAMVLEDKGEYGEAMRLSRETLTLARKILGEEHEEVSTLWSNLGVLLLNKGEYEEAEAVLRRVLALNRNLYGDTHHRVSQVLNNLAVVLERRGKLEDAEALHREALALRRRIFGERHPKIVNSLNNLAVLLHSRGRPAAAEPLGREALALAHELWGDQSRIAALVADNLARVLVDRGAGWEAEALSREALALRRRLLGEDHAEVARSLSTLAAVLEARGSFAASASAAREALDIFHRKVPEDWRRIAETQGLLGGSLSGLGSFAEAEPLLRESYSVLAAELGARSPQVERARSRLLHLYTTWDRPDSQSARTIRNGSLRSDAALAQPPL